MNYEQRGSIYAVLSGFLYGFIGYFGMNAIHEKMSVSTMLAWRFSITSLVIFLFILPKIRTIGTELSKMVIAFVTGAIFYGFSTHIYFQASECIGSGMAMVIFFTYPVFILAFNYFFYRDPIPKIYVPALFSIALGMLLLVDFSHISFNLTGIFLALASAFFYACYIISSKNNRISPLLSALMVSLGCMTTALLISLLTQSFTLPTSLSLWQNLTGIAIIATAIPILLMLRSLELISSTKASILSVLEPAFVVIWGVVLLGEPLTNWNLIGMSLILVGALLTLFGQKNSSRVHIK